MKSPFYYIPISHGSKGKKKYEMRKCIKQVNLTLKLGIVTH